MIQLVLKVVIDDADMPMHRVVVFEVEGAGIDAQDKRVKTVAERLEHYYALLSNAIRAQTKARLRPPQ